jgi:hypothetical protein
LRLGRRSKSDYLDLSSLSWIHLSLRDYVFFFPFAFIFRPFCHAHMPFEILTTGTRFLVDVNICIILTNTVMIHDKQPWLFFLSSSCIMLILDPSIVI